MSSDALLGRVLTEPTTGLPNLPYFRLIRDWEERRGARRQYHVTVLRLTVNGGDERALRSLPWRLCHELRESDLIAAEDLAHYNVLLTSPDAEHADAVAERIRRIAEELNRHPAVVEPVGILVELDERLPSSVRGEGSGPCDPCEAERLDESRESDESRHSGDSGDSGGPG